MGALTGVAQLIEHHHSQGTCLGCRFGPYPLVGVHVGGNQLMFLFCINVSISLSLPSPLAKNIKNKILKK